MSSSDAPTDEALAAAAAAGDRAALDTLLARHVDRVHAVCRRVLRNRDDALDATQEALIIVARRIGAYDGQARFTTWLYRVATNAAIDESRRRARRATPVELPADAGAAIDPSEATADRLDVDEALKALPEEFRRAVALRDLGGFDYAQIAEILDIPAGTVRSRISRGRGMLATLLSDRDRNHPGHSDRPNEMS